MMDGVELKPIVESLLFASERPLTIRRMAEILDGSTPTEVERAMATLMDEYRSDGRGIELVEVAGGYQLRTRPEYAPWVGKMHGDKSFRMSRPALESLAVIAYRQPVTRAEIEEIRGVDVSGVVHLLLDRGLIKVRGRKEVPGRPFLYGTTAKFLETFGLKNLSELPSPKEWQELNE